MEANQNSYLRGKSGSKDLLMTLKIRPSTLIWKWWNTILSIWKSKLRKISPLNTGSFKEAFTDNASKVAFFFFNTYFSDLANKC